MKPEKNLHQTNFKFCSGFRGGLKLSPPFLLLAITTAVHNNKLASTNILDILPPEVDPTIQNLLPIQAPLLLVTGGLVEMTCMR